MAEISAYSAYEELSGGEVGAATISLLRRLAAQVTGTSSFPPPDGYDRWSNGALDYLIGEMFTKAGPVSFAIACFTKAHDQGSLERLLLTAIRNQLIDEAKKTERGKLRRRLEGLLGEDARFTRITAAEAGTDCWALTGGDAGRWQGDLSALESAAGSVRGVAIRRWNTAGPTPAETKQALLIVAERILVAAGGCVSDEELARAVESRFALLTSPRFVALETDEGLEESAAEPGDEPAALVTSQARAEELWDSLTPTERAVVPHLGSSAQEIAAILEVGIAKARTFQQRVADKLRLATVDDDEADDVLLFLLQLCQVRP